MKKTVVADWNTLKDKKPVYALVANVDLVVVRFDDEVSVFYGRCAHRGALMCDGLVAGHNLICGVHNWDYRLDTGISEYNNSESLHKFTSWVEDGQVWVDADEIAAWEKANPQPYNRSAYQGLYADIHGASEEPYTAYIYELAAHGLERVGHHGKVAAMGVPRQELPMWEDIQFVTAQLHRLPQLDDVPVGHDLVIGPGRRNR